MDFHAPSRARVFLAVLRAVTRPHVDRAYASRLERRWRDGPAASLSRHAPRLPVLLQAGSGARPCSGSSSACIAHRDARQGRTGSVAVSVQPRRARSRGWEKRGGRPKSEKIRVAGVCSPCERAERVRSPAARVNWPQRLRLAPCTRMAEESETGNVPDADSSGRCHRARRAASPRSRSTCPSKPRRTSRSRSLRRSRVWKR